jgi:hypothetical protein
MKLDLRNVLVEYRKIYVIITLVEVFLLLTHSVRGS